MTWLEYSETLIPFSDEWEILKTRMIDEAWCQVQGGSSGDYHRNIYKNMIEKESLIKQYFTFKL